MSFSDFLNWDQKLLLLINTVWIAPWADTFFSFITNFHKNFKFSIPLAILLLGFLLIKDWRGALKVLLSLILVVAISDLVCYRLIKKQVERPRPKDNMELVGQLRLIGQAQGTSFPSNHTSNCFAAAVILTHNFRKRYLFYTLAGIIGYSRIYLGVHYPSDVLAGAIIGILVGVMCNEVLFPLINRLFLRRIFS